MILNVEQILSYCISGDGHIYWQKEIKVQRKRKTGEESGMEVQYRATEARVRLVGVLPGEEEVRKSEAVPFNSCQPCFQHI